MSRVLVVDDEPGVQESLRMLLKSEWDVSVAGDVASALREIARDPPDLVLLDLVMPGRSGFDLLEDLNKGGVEIPVIVLTATKTVATAVEAMQRGASDFVTKPFEIEALRIKIRQLLEHRALADEVVRLRNEVRGRQSLGSLIGRSPVMQEVFRNIDRIAQSRANVLVSGESGTGKELVARAIHDGGSRREKPFVAINCGAIPHHLMESELFGHEKGAFTGAVERRIGKFEAASGGTLLLDEIGELEAPLQVKLLRAIQEQRIDRLGANDPIAVDVRVIAATNRDLEEEVSAGRFRADLFYRIHVVSLQLPPLRERGGDIGLLAEAFLARAAQREGEDARAVTLSPAAAAALEAHSWPGNVRELENAIEHGLALCQGGTIAPADLPDSIDRGEDGAGGHDGDALHQDWRAGRLSYQDAVAQFERELLLDALERHHWNQTQAAAHLGMTRRVLKLKMDRFELKPPAG